MATLAALRTEMRTAAIEPATDPMFTDQNLTRWINQGLAKIAGEADWPWLLKQDTFTASGPTTTLPTNWARTKKVYVAGRPAHRLNYPAAKNTVTGTWLYSVFDGQLTIHPDPLGNQVDHVYVARENTLSADTDSPLLPDRWVPLLVAEVMVQWNLGSNDMPEAREWRGEYLRLLAAAKQTELRGGEMVVVP